MDHTILLLQSHKDKISRTYFDYRTIRECLESICLIFEGNRKNAGQYRKTTSRDILEIYDSLDQMEDIVCFVFEASSKMYAPHNKTWIKEQLYLFLKPTDG